MIFTNTYTIGMEDIGYNNEATNKAILSFLEDIACLHSATAGYGVMDINTKKRAWLLLDWRLEVMRRPVYDEVITVDTWSRGFDRISAFRDFHIRDEKGTIIAKASSRWLLTDTEKRRPVRLNSDITEPYMSEDRSAFSEEKSWDTYDISAIQEKLCMEYRVMRRDIDINKHMHNITYLEIAMEALPENVYGKALFNSVRIQYKKEIRPEENIKLYYIGKNKIHTVILSVDDKINAVVELEE